MENETPTPDPAQTPAPELATPTTTAPVVPAVVVAQESVAVTPTATVAAVATTPANEAAATPAVSSFVQQPARLAHTVTVYVDPELTISRNFGRVITKGAIGVRLDDAPPHAAMTEQASALFLAASLAAAHSAQVVVVPGTVGNIALEAPDDKTEWAHGDLSAFLARETVAQAQQQAQGDQAEAAPDDAEAEPKRRRKTKG